MRVRVPSTVSNQPKKCALITGFGNLARNAARNESLYASLASSSPLKINGYLNWQDSFFKSGCYCCFRNLTNFQVQVSTMDGIPLFFYFPLPIFAAFASSSIE
ncbi:hypothetical protein CDAR_495441 [Caerostris darwini]|uniref:Uncharacterized protein n=1 Tax=Caerostris darwini TaxID=1538125 RepID=A0AAV4SDL4_9ARAC|nr:hypothetical protein CDAR_495441 [Caerostris darwini]